MREIGSEFWDMPITGIENDIFPKTTQWFLSGRIALQAIIQNINHCHSVAMPSWCCDSMVKPFTDAGIEVHFYPVYWNNGLVQSISIEDDILFLMDYFGYSSQQPELGGFEGVIIRDVTHSIFSSSYDDADYYFGSLRKWCGVLTGGYAWTKDGQQLRGYIENNNKDIGYISLRRTAMLQKAEYISGIRKDKEFLELFNKADSILETAGIISAADDDVELSKKLDIKKIISQRRNNAAILRSAFPDWLMFRTMKETDCPLFSPVLIPDGKRDRLRDFLIKQDIYCPVHWPINNNYPIDEKTKYIYQNELSLICDQRYSGEDMQRIVDTIHLFMEG